MTTLALHLMTIRLSDEFGAVLVGRGAAKRLRLRIEEAARVNGEGVMLDFEGVLTVSPSFADELFAKLNPTLREAGRVQLQHMSPALESIARFVVAGRPDESS